MAREKLKLVEGENENQNPQPCPEPPQNLCFEGRDEWVKVADIFHQANLLNPFVQSLLESYCACIGAARRARAMVLNDGDVVNGKLHPQVNNELNQGKQASSEWSKLCALLEAQKDREIKLRELALAEKLANKNQNENTPWDEEKRKLLA